MFIIRHQTPEVFWRRFKEAQLGVQTALDAVTGALGLDLPGSSGARGGGGVGGELPGAQLLSTATPAGRLREQREQRAAAAERAAAVITADALSDARKAELLARLTPLSGSIDGMQKMAAGAAFYLPPFDIRSAATSLRKMRATLASTKELVQPKKKFSFKEKRAARKAAAEAKKAAKKAKKEAERLQRLAAGGDAPSASSGDKKVKVKATQASFLPTVVDYTVRAKRNETITVPPGALSEWAAQELEEKDKEGGAGTGGETSKSRDVVLADLEDCVVFLGDTMSALRVDNLRRCHVYGGPVAGSLLLEGCEDCTFWLASRQIRLHHGVRCTFHLRVMSNPIIEDCSELSFAPYNIEYDGLRGQLAAAGLGSTSRGMWKQVQDFKWHRAQHSPNWATIDADSSKWIKTSRHGDVRILDAPLVLEADTE